MSEASIKPLYVLHGCDAFLLDARRRAIVAAVVGDGDPQLCVTTLDGSAELAEVLDELRTLPFLAPRRLAILRDADDFVTAHREALEKFFGSPPAASSLVLLVSSWKSNTRLAKLAARIGEVSDCSEPARGDLPRWIQKFAAQRNKQLDRQAADVMAECVGGDLGLLDNEMEKLCLYVGDRKQIAAEDVAAVVSATTNPVAFALTNAITAGDTAGALRALAQTLQVRGDEFKTLGTIAWHLRRALTAKEQLAAGQPPRQALPKMPYAQQNTFLAMLTRRPVGAFHRDFRALIQADLALKTGAETAAALQQLVLELCS